MKKFQNVIACGLIAITLGGTIAPMSSVFASERKTETVTLSENSSEKALLEELGVTQEEFDYYINLPMSDLYLYNNPEQPSPRGKMGAVIKAIRKGYSKLPSGVKKTINRFTSLEVILGTLDHWTGAVEDGIVWACKQAGMPDSVAWFVAKALTALAL